MWSAAGELEHTYHQTLTAYYEATLLQPAFSVLQKE